MKRSRDSSKLKFQSGARFSCSSCGKCCRSGFQIPVEQHRAKKVRASSTYQSLVKEGYYPLRVEGGVSFLNYDEHEGCYFHRNALCSLHSEHGLSHKPTVCQMYPFNAVPTPDGVYVSLLYSCPAVVAQKGAPLEHHAEELRELFRSATADGFMLSPLKRHILVTSGSTVTWHGTSIWSLNLDLRALSTSSTPCDTSFTALAGCCGPIPRKPSFKDRVVIKATFSTTFLRRWCGRSPPISRR